MNTNFSPAPGCIVIIPMYEDDMVADLKLSLDFIGTMPVGKVVCAGRLPIGFPKLKSGDTIAYQRGNYIEMAIDVDGVKTNVSVIYGPDFRGKFISNEKNHFWSLFVTPFALGATVGYIAGQFFTVKDIVRKFAHNNRFIQFLVSIIGHKSSQRD